VLHFSNHKIIPKLKFRSWPCSMGGFKTFYSKMTNVNSCNINSVTGELKRIAEEVVVVHF
jgi:hypothetical protein